MKEKNKKNIRKKNKKNIVRSGIRTHAHRSGLRPERSALDRSAILTTYLCKLKIDTRLATCSFSKAVVLMKLKDNFTMDKKNRSPNSIKVAANDLVAPTALLEAIDRLKWPPPVCVC